MNILNKVAVVAVVLAAGTAFARIQLGDSNPRAPVAATKQIDLYAISDPTNLLAAIKAKWPHAADRVSQWEMPDYEERFSEIDKFQDWCNDDAANRYGQFEEACRDAIAMKIEPAIWYYNLACALAVQGKPKNEVFDALEQAVAAGYNRPDRAMSDVDFQSVTNDARFAKLCEAMDLINGAWDVPRKALEEGDSEHVLSEDNVHYVFKRSSYLCHIAATSVWPVVYLNHHAAHDVVPCEGVVVPKFTREAIEAGRARGAANMHFLHLFASKLHRKERFCPTIVASNWTATGEDRLSWPMSIPATCGMASGYANKEAQHHWEWNCLGIYTAASDYGFDGIDRFVGHFPLCIAHYGGADEADKFVRLCREVIEVMPIEARVAATMPALNIIRHAQKCVKDENDFMSGIAQRPVLKYSDIDREKALALARRDASVRVPFSPPIKESSIISRTKPCTDLWDFPFDTIQLSEALFNNAYISRQAEKSLAIRVVMYDPKHGELVWKVLQGDEGKIRIAPKNEDKSIVEIEVDWHNVFDVRLPDGTMVKSSRVDVGCFRVYDGIASVPSIISVYFSPNETREYGADGKLLSIDYAKRQLDGYCPSMCAKGDWKDVFHWNSFGEMTGWTRFLADTNGRVTTNEFTREGLMVDTRDASGRPKDVHRSLASTWKQHLRISDFTNEVGSAKLGYYGSQYDLREEPPAETTLAWKYDYENDADRLGEPSPKEPEPFRYRPELCLRADFSKESGFSLPLVDQMEFGYYSHVSYRHDMVEWFSRGDELMREDSRFAIEGQGLKQPEALRKMKFCPWKPGTNDLWKIDGARLEGEIQGRLLELPDGVYRAWARTDGADGVSCKSVDATYRDVNFILEAGAYERLDAAYRRCRADEVRKMMSDRATDEDWAAIQIVEGVTEHGWSQFYDIPEGKNFTLAMWQIKDNLYFGVHAARRKHKGPVQYFFRKIDKGSGRPLTIDFFRQVPSPAIGNAVLGADVGEADALNNFAVLFYAGIANPERYDESAVIKLLRRAEKLGCPLARYNLEVLYYNRGEQDKAKESVR